MLLASTALVAGCPGPDAPPDPTPDAAADGSPGVDGGPGDAAEGDGAALDGSIATEASADAPAEASPDACTFLEACVGIAISSQPAESLCGRSGSYGVRATNGCGQSVSCVVTLEDPIPPPLGQPLPRPTTWSGVLAVGGATAFESCAPNSQASARCVPVAQATRCLPGADAGPPPPPPACATCMTHALPPCPDPNPDLNAFGVTCCPASVPYFTCDGSRACSAAPMCCNQSCSCTFSCGGGGSA